MPALAQTGRTTAALATDGATIVGGGVRDLDPLQRFLQANGELLAKLRGAHAEATVLQKATEMGLMPQAIAASRPFCGPDKEDCRQLLLDLGATLIGEPGKERVAIW